jgi:hypothetical protein
MNIAPIKDAFGAGRISAMTSHGETTITAHRDILIPLLRFLKEREEYAFDFLTDLCGVDHLPESPRSGQGFKNIHDRLALAERVEQGRHGALHFDMGWSGLARKGVLRSFWHYFQGPSEFAADSAAAGI